MAFTYDPTTDRGKVRLLLRDTDTVNSEYQLYTDAEIDAFLSMAGSDIYLAASDACLALATDAARQAILYRVLNQDLEMDRRQIPRMYRELAAEYKKQAANQGGFSLDLGNWKVGSAGVDDTDLEPDDSSLDRYQGMDYQKGDDY